VGGWKEWPRLHDLSPDLHHRVIGDRTIRQLKNADWIVVWMQSNHPIVAASTKGERQLAAVPPLLLAAHNVRKLNGAFADACEGVADDATFRLELRLILDVLQLAAAAFVDPVMVTERLHAFLRGREYLLDSAARKPLPGIERRPHAITRRRPRTEHDDLGG